MPHSAIWELFGDFINEHHSRTLAAYLGDCDAELALDAESILFPMSDDFHSDPVFDPDLHRLNLSSGYVDTALLSMRYNGIERFEAEWMKLALFVAVSFLAVVSLPADELKVRWESTPPATLTFGDIGDAVWEVAFSPDGEVLAG